MEAISKVGVIGDGVVELRPYTRDTSGALVEAYLESETELRRFMPWANQTEEQALGFIDGAIREHAEGKGVHFSMHALEDGGRYVGGVGLHHVAPFTPSAEVGYWVRTSCAGRGFATRGLGVLLRCCETEMGLARVKAFAAEANPASQRVLEKSGFVREGFHPRAELCHGVWHALVSFGLLLGEV